jgi:hypothetical protein
MSDKPHRNLCNCPNCQTDDCPNCQERKAVCACLSNTCIQCGKPVGNITFTVCDECWDKPPNGWSEPQRENEHGKH